MGWGESVENKSKLRWWRRELSRSGDSLGEGRGGIVIIENRHWRRLGAELRAGCCELEVEMGRCRGTKKDGICKLCGKVLRMRITFINMCKR